MLKKSREMVTMTTMMLEADAPVDEATQTMGTPSDACRRAGCTALTE